MRIEEAIFKSAAWNSIKSRLPSPVRRSLASGLLKAKRWYYALRCLMLSRGYVKNWAASVSKELILPEGSYIRYRLEDLYLTIRAKSYDKFIVQEINSGSYAIALDDLPERPVVIDAGAHIGVFAAEVLRRFPQAKLFCVEPIAENLKLLRKNIEMNGWLGVAAVIEGLLSKNEDTKTIYKREGHSAGFNLYMPTDVTYQAKSHTLEGLLNDNGIERCDLLKLDIEGGEYEVLRNTPDHVLRKIDRIVMEYHPFPKESADIAALSAHLFENGYEVDFYAPKMLYAKRMHL